MTKSPILTPRSNYYYVFGSRRIPLVYSDCASVKCDLVRSATVMSLILRCAFRRSASSGRQSGFPISHSAAPRPNLAQISIEGVRRPPIGAQAPTLCNQETLDTLHCNVPTPTVSVAPLDSRLSAHNESPALLCDAGANPGCEQASFNRWHRPAVASMVSRCRATSRARYGTGSPASHPDLM